MIVSRVSGAASVYGGGEIMGSGGGKLQPVWRVFRVEGDFFQNGRKRFFRLPIPYLAGFPGIEHKPWKIKGTWSQIRRNRMMSPALLAPAAELPEGHRVRVASGCVTMTGPPLAI